jgi:hypothetical protein
VERKWKRARANSGDCLRGGNIVSAPASRNLSLDQNVQKHFFRAGIQASRWRIFR